MKSLIFFDTETTSLEEGRLVEFALSFDGSGGVRVGRVKPPVPISFEAMAVHHITEEDVAECPPFSDMKDIVSDIFKDKIAVAHNAPFDVEVMRREGIEIPIYLDTKRVAQHLFPDAKEVRLGYLRYYLGAKVDLPCIPHTAECDVRVLMAVFEKLQQKVGEKYELDTDEAIIEKMLKLTHQPVLLERLTFGKYCGRTFADVNIIDRGYIVYLFKGNNESRNPDLQRTLEYWMGQH